MKRRDFLTTSAGLAGALLPVVGRAQSRPCPPSSITASGGTSTTTVCAPGDAEADWVARSAGAGVVWAHDFRNAAEFTNFHERDYGWKLANGSWGYDSSIPGGLESSGSPGISTMSRLAGGGIPGTAGAAVVSSSPYGFTGYPSTTYAVSGTGGSVDVYFPDRPMENWNGGMLKMQNRVASANWVRPFAGLSTGNGLGAPDIGVTRGTVTGRTWDTTSRSTYGNFRKGFYGHRDYWGTSGTAAGDWDGTEFYLQLRVKFSAGRFGHIDGATAGPYGTAQSPYPGRVYAAGGKLLWIVDNQGNDGEWITVSGGNQSKRYDSQQNGGEPFVMYTNRPSETLTYPFLGPTGYVNGRTEPGGPYDACDINNNLGPCWRWPDNEWVTLLYWMKPGHQGGNWQPDNMRYPQDTYFRVYMATQSMINAARNAGTSPQYVDMFKMPDGTGRWWRYDPADTDRVKPGAYFSFLLFNGYMNNTPSVVGFTQSITQVVFSQQFIPCPQV